MAHTAGWRHNDDYTEYRPRDDRRQKKVLAVGRGQQVSQTGTRRCVRSTIKFELGLVGTALKVDRFDTAAKGASLKIRGVRCRSCDEFFLHSVTL
jgi:hypothetical protein